MGTAPSTFDGSYYEKAGRPLKGEDLADKLFTQVTTLVRGGREAIIEIEKLDDARRREILATLERLADKCFENNQHKDFIIKIEFAENVKSLFNYRAAGIGGGVGALAGALAGIMLTQSTLIAACIDVGAVATAAAAEAMSVTALISALSAKVGVGSAVITTFAGPAGFAVVLGGALAFWVAGNLFSRKALTVGIYASTERVSIRPGEPVDLGGHPARS